MVPETSKNKLNHQSSQVEENTSEVNEVTVITKECISHSLENDTPQSELLTEYCESQNNFTRIYLLRHLPYKECREYSLYEDIRDKLKEKLTNDKIHKYLEEKYGDFYNNLIKDFEQGENPIKLLFSMLDDSLCTDSSILDPNLYDSIFQDQKNTIFIHNPIDSSKERIKQSVNYIKTSYPDINFQEENIVGSQKGIDKQLAVMKAGKELVEIIVDIKSEIKQENSKLRGKNIVILGSRTHSHFLNVKKFNTNGKDQTEGEFEEKGYNFIDLGDNLDIIDDTSKLIINPENYLELKSLFPEIQHNSITDFHYKLNTYFMENPELFEVYLLSDNPELRFFCIANLIKNGEFNLVLENITKLFEKEKEENIIGFGNNLLRLCDKNQKKDIFESLEGKTSIITKLNLESLEYQVNYNEFVKDNINYLREKTQDENIRNGKRVSMSVGFKEEQYNAIENLLNSDKILLIEATAGSGKSIKLLEILEYLSPKENTSENKYFPIYVHLGKSKKINDIKKEIERQKTGLYGTGKYQYIYLFDAIDEALMDEKTKEEFLEIIKKLQETSKVIITSRHGHIVDTDIKKIELKALTTEQIDQYIQGYIAGNQEWKNIWVKWKQDGFIEEIKDNPLMLSILVEVIKNIDKIKKLKEYGIIENLDIEKKSDLFDIIVTLRLYEGEIKKTEEGEERTEIEIKNIINNRKEILELIAIESVERDKSLSKEEIDILINNNELSGGMLGKNRFLENLNLIFKYNSETNQYQFVHEKFKEYFTYMNFIKIIGSKKNTNKKIWVKYLNEYLQENKGPIYLKEFSSEYYGTILFKNYRTGTILYKLSCIQFNNIEFSKKYIEDFINIFADEKYAIEKLCHIIPISILEKIIISPIFINNKDAIKNFCWIIGTWKSEKGLSILEKIITLPGFVNNKIAIDNYCLAIGKIKSEKGLPLLEKIITLPGFIDNKNAIDNFCWAIGEIKSKKGISIIEKIIPLPGFVNNKAAMEKICFLIGEIKPEKGISILEKIVTLPGFIKSEKLSPIMKKTIEIYGLINYEEVIGTMCWSIGRLKSEKGLPILEKIIPLHGFKNNKEAIYFACLAIREIQNQEGVKLSQKLQQFLNKYNQN